jgi:hypothetical protein
VSSFVEKRQAVFPNRVPRDLPSFLPWWEKRTFE